MLIEFRGEVFILTAGHVIDGFDSGDLMVPHSDNKIESIDGVYSYIKPIAGRDSDKLDFGYFKLDKHFADSVKRLFYAIPEVEFGTKDHYREKEFISFGGYPHRKHNVAGGIASTPNYIYGAYHASLSEYGPLGCDPKLNIVAKFNQKKTINPHNGNIQIAPLPHGISGGGVFVWPPAPKELIPSDRKLIGIGHTYISKHGYFIGTRLEIVLKAILQNNPQLAIST
ncbi:MAG: hypothetical protein U5M23_05230 [Marinagarivorans sp.]|nr:hypothetical protein [Marinagarivorans sp.]